MSELRRTKAVETAAEASERTQLYNTALNVKQQYFNGLAARELEAAALRQLEQAEQQMAVSTARVRAGAATKSDSLRSVIQVGNARLAVLSARNSLQVANAGLTRLVGTDFVVTASPTDTLAPAAVMLDNETLVSMLDASPALQQAEADLAAARAAVKTARAAWLPSVSASYSFSANQSSSGFETGNLFLLGGQNPNNKRLNFNVSYPLFNQLQRETSITQAQVTERNAEATLRDARLAARQTLTQALGTLRLAEERAAIQDASVAAAEEDLRVQTQRYQLGAATLLDVLTSQTTLNQARAALIQARYDARVAKAQIEALVGKEL
jgi:outer membrane protein